LGAGSKAGDVGDVLATDCRSNGSGGRGDGSGDRGRVDVVVGVDGCAKLAAEGLGRGVVGGRAADFFAGREDGAVGGAALAGNVSGGTALNND